MFAESTYAERLNLLVDEEAIGYGSSSFVLSGNDVKKARIECGEPATYRLPKMLQAHVTLRESKISSKLGNLIFKRKAKQKEA